MVNDKQSVKDLIDAILADNQELAKTVFHDYVTTVFKQKLSTTDEPLEVSKEKGV